jgi:hypothetical protein
MVPGVLDDRSRISELCVDGRVGMGRVVERLREGAALERWGETVGNPVDKGQATPLNPMEQ